jgi:adenylate cyclase
MAGKWKVRIQKDLRDVFEREYTGALELGRQAKDESGTFAERDDAESKCRRLVIVESNEQTIYQISRRHLRLEPQPDGRIRLTNLSDRLPVQLLTGRSLKPKESRSEAMPVAFSVAGLQIFVSGDEEQAFVALPEATMPPGANNQRLPSRFLTIQPASRQGDQTVGAEFSTTTESQAEEMIAQLKATLDVFQSAANDHDLFRAAASTVKSMVGLDTARVVLLGPDGWRDTLGERAAEQGESAHWAASKSVLARVQREKRTFRQAAGRGPSTFDSLTGVTSVVASPILNKAGEVIGALYGDRRREGLSATLPQITQLEAMLVEVLASAVAAGLSRLDNEKKALEQRVKFSQFFTPELARQLEENPNLLKGDDFDITVLFCDIRHFSTIAERIGPEMTMQWMNDIMQELSVCVLENEGVLVDYIGDELMAMWGAPEKDVQHPRKACRAALAMLERLDVLNGRWRTELGEDFSLGIGVNTGRARVGNTGTKLKFKYGPLGDPVNIASRVQGLTKYLQTRLLVTQGTLDAIKPLLEAEGYYTPFQHRRVCATRLVNIKKPVALYELTPTDMPGGAELNESYEQALTAFESQKFQISARMLGNLLDRFEGDGPSRVLLARAVGYLIEPPSETKPFDPVWTSPGK